MNKIHRDSGEIREQLAEYRAINPPPDKLPPDDDVIAQLQFDLRQRRINSLERELQAALLSEHAETEARTQVNVVSTGTGDAIPLRKVATPV